MNESQQVFLVGVAMGFVLGLFFALVSDRHASPKRMDVLLRAWNERVQRKRKQADAILASLNKESDEGDD